MPDTGTYRLKYDTTTVLTDGSPTLSFFVDTNWTVNLIIDITTDKGATLVVTPCLSKTDDTALAPPSDTVIIADLGESVRAVYSAISAERAKITLTKTEAGSSSAILLSLRSTRE